MSDAEVIQALASAQHARDPYLGNVLATEALNRADRAQAALQHLPGAVITTDSEGRIRFANPAARALLAADDLTGRDFHGLVHPEHDARGNCTLVAPLFEGGPRLLENERLRRIDGSSFPAVCSVAPLLREGDRFGLVIAFRDITGAEREREARLAAEERYRSLFEALPDAVFSVDLDGAFVDVNPAGAALGGYAKEDLLGQPFAAFVAPEDLDRILTHFLAAVAGERQEAEFAIVHRDGRKLRVSAVAVPLRQHGEIAGIHAVARILPQSSSAGEPSRET